MQNTDADTPGHPALASGRLAYPINDFADAVGIGRSKVYEEIANGRLQAKIGARTIITAKAASDYLDRLPDLDTKAA